jgi:hypothetical protein
VGVLEGGQKLVGDVERVGDRQRLAARLDLVEQVGERDPIDELDDQVWPVAVVDPEIEDLDDVSVVQSPGDLGLGDQRRAKLGRPGRGLAQPLDRSDTPANTSAVPPSPIFSASR